MKDMLYSYMYILKVTLNGHASVLVKTKDLDIERKKKKKEEEKKKR